MTVPRSRRGGRRGSHKEWGSAETLCRNIHHCEREEREGRREGEEGKREGEEGKREGEEGKRDGKREGGREGGTRNVREEECEGRGMLGHEERGMREGWTDGWIDGWKRV